MPKVKTEFRTETKNTLHDYYYIFFIRYTNFLSIATPFPSSHSDILSKTLMRNMCRKYTRVRETKPRTKKHSPIS